MTTLFTIVIRSLVSWRKCALRIRHMCAYDEHVTVSCHEHGKYVQAYSYIYHVQLSVDIQPAFEKANENNIEIIRQVY